MEYVIKRTNKDEDEQVLKLNYRAVIKEDYKKDLMHYKYIARKKVNGKWRYWYDNNTKNKNNKKISETDKELEKLTEQYKDVLFLSLHDYEKLSDEDKKKWEEANDEYEAKRKQILEGFDIDEVAKKTIAGEFGNGSDRKEHLGESYTDVQKRVNEILKSPSSETTITKSSIDKGKNHVDNILSSEYEKKIK